MAAASRDFKIVYGTLTVGTDSSPDMPLHGPLTMRKTPEEFECSFQFWVFGSGPSDLEANCATAETALRTPFQNLAITMGDGSTNDVFWTFSNSSGTGFDAVATIEKEGNPADSPRSRLYTVSIILQLPADTLGSTSGQYGRREGTVSVSQDAAGRREVKISGAYTATDTSNSGKQTGREQYLARIDAYATAVLTAIDTNATWELVGAPLAEIDETDTASLGLGKVCRFERTYEELTYPQGNTSSAGSPNDASIKQQRLNISRSRHNRDNLEHLNEVGTLDQATVTYECFVDVGTAAQRTAGTADVGARLVTKYEIVIRPFLFTQARDLLGITTLQIIEENVSFDLDLNKIACTMTIGGIAPGEGTVSSVDITDGYTDTGRSLVPFLDGDPHSALEVQGPAKYTRTIHVVEHVLTMTTSNPVGRDGFEHPPNGIVKSRVVRHSPIQINLHFDNTSPSFSRGIRETTIVIEFYSPLGGNAAIGRDLNQLDDALAPGGGLDQGPGFGV
jgi:hypothetical protein